jgi:hypothetical protein
MFYKSSNRSTVLDRQPTQSNDHKNPTEDRLPQNDLVDANRRAEEAKKSKLSVFEKELLQAWFQDQ